MSRKALRSLEELSSDYSSFLFDTCTLIRPYKKDRKPKIVVPSLSEMAESIQIELNSAISFSNHFKQQDNFYVTKNVLGEYIYSKSYPYKVKIKKKSVQHNRGKLELCRKIKELLKERRRLANVLEDNGRVLAMKVGERLLHKDFSVKYYNFVEKYLLSNTDFDLLISGAVLSKTKDPVALFSIDFGIGKAWKELLEREKMSQERFGFFGRFEFNGYSPFCQF